MNIQILDSWLRDHLKTKATPREIGEKLSLTSVSVERIDDFKEDKRYDIEVTTNRPDLMSVVGLARETAAILPQFGMDATFVPPVLKKPHVTSPKNLLTIESDDKLVYRICAVVMDVSIGESPQYIKDRLEASGIRSLNNLIDVTNYVMRTIGHPAHVFDFDRLATDKLVIRESYKGEKITTLDGKIHTLTGGDIVAVDATGRIVDLLGIMGLDNSVITNQTKRILFFLDNNDPLKMRKTSMELAVRSEAAQLNEKGVDPELALDALLYGISLYAEIADGKVVSDIIDIYPKKPKEKKITVSKEKIDTIIGVPIPLQKAKEILERLNFKVSVTENTLTATVPSFRFEDISIEEDIIEEIARVYGYHNLPSILPQIQANEPYHLSANPFYWEKKVKEALKYWGFTEAYTYSMVSESMYEGPIEDAVTLRNPLGDDYMYMRTTLVPSLLKVIEENKQNEIIKIFELANVYHKKENDLPTETRMLSGVFKKNNASFYEIKGVIEQLFTDLGVEKFVFKPTTKGGLGADIFIEKTDIGEIEVLDDILIDFEINFELLMKHATLKKKFTPLSKYPPIIEDITFVLTDEHATGDMIELIMKQNRLIRGVTLLDRYQNTRTFHIIYQDTSKNLTNEDVVVVREKITKTLNEKFNATVK